MVLFKSSFCGFLFEGVLSIDISNRTFELIKVQFGEYFQSVLADSGIGYFPLLLIIWHFCHKNLRIRPQTKV